jgi:hypothetical protein
MRRLFTIEWQDRASGRWFPFVAATAMDQGYCRGFAAGLMQKYPCPPLRMIKFHPDTEDHPDKADVVDKWDGHGEVVPQ